MGISQKDRRGNGTECAQRAHHEAYAADAQVLQDVSDRGVLSAVVWQPQCPVGIHSVQSLFLHHKPITPFKQYPSAIYLSTFQHMPKRLLLRVCHDTHDDNSSSPHANSTSYDMVQPPGPTEMLEETHPCLECRYPESRSVQGPVIEN